MKLRYLIMTVWVGLCLAQTVFAQIPSGYYDAVDGKSGAALKTALCEVVRPHTKLSYSDLWTAYEYTDVVPGTTDQVHDMFSTQEVYYSSRGNAINREHVCPKSWWGGSTVECYSDLFNVYPSNVQANSAKSNYPLGVVTGEVRFENGRVKVGKTSQGSSAYAFEPCDEFKGDFARVYLYVATCYQDYNWEYDYAFEEGVNTYPTFQSWIIPLLLEWHAMDPVSEWEIGRNNRVYTIQGNRNPFIDYPSLANHIWGDKSNEAFDLASAEENGHITPPSDDEDDETDDPIIPDDPDMPGEGDDDEGGDAVVSGTLLFNETFDSIEVGNSEATSGSSSQWDGNENFSSYANVYCAGGALRMGASKKVGSLTTTTLDYSGEEMIVEVDVKGWTTVEGHLLVSASGTDAVPLVYDAVMADDFQTVSVRLSGFTANPSVTLETSAKRCFLDAIRIYAVSSSGIDDIEAEQPACPLTGIYDMMGRRYEELPARGGIFIVNGRKVVRY